MHPRQAEIDKKWAEINVVSERDKRVHKACGAYGMAQGFKAKVDMVMVCRFCGKELLHMKAGECNTHDVLGTCDCWWRCCERAGHRHHERHLVWIPEEPANEQ